MALSLSLTVSPVPPPHKAEAAKPQSHIKIQPSVKTPVSTKPQALTQAETPQPVTTAVVETPPTTPAPAFDASCVTGYFTGNSQEDYIINHESGGNSCATNYLGCFGLMQACPGEPLREACGGNPACQLDWFWTNKVMAGDYNGNVRYGSWAAVYNHEIAYGWW